MLRPKFVTFLMPILKRQVNSSANFVSFFTVMTHNFFVNFKLIYCLLWIKASHQSPNFETFDCSGETFPNSFRHFPNHKSVFLQILHHFLVLWDITPLYFLAEIWYTFNKSKSLVKSLVSSQKSEILHFDTLFSSKWYYVSAKKGTEELSLMTLKSDSKFEEKLTFDFNMTWGIWRIFTQATRSLKISLWWALFAQRI